MQCCRWGLSRADQRGRIPSLYLMPALPLMQPRIMLVSALRAHMAWARPASHRPHHSCPKAQCTSLAAPQTITQGTGCPQPAVKALALPGPVSRGSPVHTRPPRRRLKGRRGAPGWAAANQSARTPLPSQSERGPSPRQPPSPARRQPRAARGDSLPAASPHRHLGAGLSRGKTPPPTPAGGPRG